MSRHYYVGRKIIRDDGPAKATGRLGFYADHYDPEMLHGVCVRAQYAHAKILNIDCSAALSAPGVVDVLTWRDVPGLNRFGVCAPDHPVLCDEKVRFTGDPVALVVAESLEQAVAAASLVQVAYQELPAIKTIEEAENPAAVLVHESGNIFACFDFSSGNVEDYFNDRYIVVEHDYTTPYQEHLTLETESGFAVPLEDGGVEIFAGSQYAQRDQMQLAKILNLPEEKIIIHNTPLGGGFGRKDDMMLQPLLAVAALKTGRKVHMKLTREESFLFGPKRLCWKIHMKTAADYTGKLVAHRVIASCDIGPYAGIGAAVFNYGMENCCGPYKFATVDIHGKSFYSNNMHGSSFRGFGNNQLTWAVETQLQEICSILGMDPCAFRRMNITKTGELLNFGNTHSGCDGLGHGLDMVAESKIWKDREKFKQAAAKPYLKRGVGIACCQHGNGLGAAFVDAAEADTALQEDGTFKIYTNHVDMGQGLKTTVHIIAAETLQTAYNDVEVVNGITTVNRDGGPTTASRATYMSGCSVKKSAENFIAQVRTFFTEQGRTFEQSGFAVLLDGQPCSWKDIYALLPTELRACSGRHVMPPTNCNFNIGLHYVQTHVTQVSAVEVNTLTGRVQVLESEILPAAGTVINRLGYEGQAEGGVVMAQGYALQEEFRLRDDNFPLTKNMQTYLVPTICDIPNKITVIPVEDSEESGPFGAKGLGEPVSVAGTPAITNAIFDAIGVQIFDLPASPMRILKALKNNK